MQEIKDKKISLDQLNPAVKRTLKRCLSVSESNFDNLIAEKFL